MTTPLLQTGVRHIKEPLEVEVICDKTDLKKFDYNDLWIVKKSEWNIDNQRGEVILREIDTKDI